MEEYIDVLAKMNTVTIEHGINDSIFVGDMNCHIGTVLYLELLKFCNDNQFSIIDVVRLPANSFYDHVICSNSLIHTIKDIEILNNYFISDHKAMQITIDITIRYILIIY